MAIEFFCSQCSSELKVRDEDRGKKARCPRCGMIHEVPRGDTKPAGDKVTAVHERHEAADPIDSAEQETVYRKPPAAPQRFEIDDDAGRWSMKTPDGRVYGPVHRSELDSWAAEGRVSAQCLVQLDGQSHWQSALVLYPHLASLRRRPAPETSSASTRQRQGVLGGRMSRDPRAHVGTQRLRRQQLWRPNSGVTVLVLACIGIFFIPFPVFAIMAWVMGASERRAIEGGEASPAGRWMVDLGYYMGILFTIIGIMTILGCFALVSNI